MGANAFFAFRQRREEIEKLAADKADEGRLFHRLKQIIILNLKTQKKRKKQKVQRHQLQVEVVAAAVAVTVLRQ